MRRTLFSILLILAMAGSGQAAQIELKLSGDRYWVVIASRHDRNEAVALAAYGSSKMSPFVALADNGFYAVIAGPVVAAPGMGRKVLDDLIRTKGIAKDAYLTQGGAFRQVAWTKPVTNQLATLSYDGEHDAILHHDGLDIVLSRQPATPAKPDDGFVATATATYRGTPAFRIVMDTDYPADKPASDIAIVRLDPASPMPQVVFTYFWQGAHCCTITKIATLAGTWAVVDGETLDGGGGYDFEDLDGKGFSLLVSEDQSFKYAFASYAESISPIVLHQLVGGSLIDVTREPRLRDRLILDLNGDIALADGAPDLWHANGFLAAWVAESIRVGQGAAAWARMLTSYDHQSAFTPPRCTIDKPLESCPKDKVETPSFPAALRAFLVTQGYIGMSDRYPVPFAVEPDRAP